MEEIGFSQERFGVDYCRAIKEDGREYIQYKGKSFRVGEIRGNGVEREEFRRGFCGERGLKEGCEAFGYVGVFHEAEDVSLPSDI